MPVESPNPTNSPSKSELDILAQGEDETTPEVSEEEEIPTDELEAKDETEDETEEDEDETEEEEEEDPLEAKTDEDELKPGTPPFNQLRKAHPDVFKKFPQIQANYFQAEKYKEFFPTVEEAGEAAKKAEIFDYFDAGVTKGDLSLVVEAIAENNPQSLNKVADDILPLLQSKSPQLYVRAIKPVIANMFNYANGLADKHTDKDYGTNVKAAVAVLSNLIFGESGVPDTTPKASAVDPEKEQLKQQQHQMFQQQATNFEMETKKSTYKALKDSIEENFDVEQKLTPFTRGKVIEQILIDINERLQKDPITQKLLSSHWAAAPKSGFGEQSKLQLKRAFLGRAKLILPQIRSKRYSEALGVAPRKTGGKTIIPASAGAPRAKTSKVTPQEAKSKGMSEMDIISYGANK
jgi:hypothetical protein